jgi:RNA polymerase sigma factor (sigma-70 family)
MADREDAAAWSTLEQRIRSWARAQLSTVGTDLVEDTVEDTCAAVSLSLERAYGAETFAGFVYGHYLNVRRRVLRIHARRVTAKPVAFDLPAPEVEPPVSGNHSGLYAMLQMLPSRERTAVALRYLEGASAAEIGLVLGVSEVNARQLVHRGLSRLRHPPPREPLRCLR